MRECGRISLVGWFFLPRRLMMDEHPQDVAPLPADGQPLETEPSGSRLRSPRGSAVRRTFLALLGAAPAVCLICAIAVGNFRFLWLDHAEYAGVDDADSYMDYPTKYYYPGFLDGVQWHDFHSIGFRLYSPLNFILGGLVQALTAPTPQVLRLYSASYLPFALIYVYLLTRFLFGKWAALLAVLLGGLNPLTLASSRFYTLGAPLVLPFAGGLYHAARSRGMTRPGHALAAIAWAFFTVSIKLPSCVTLAPVYGLSVAAGLFVLCREERWKRFAAMVLLLLVLAGSGVYLVLKINPHALEVLSAISKTPRGRSGFFLEIIRPYNDSKPALFYGMVDYLIGPLWMLRYQAWPMAVLAVAGFLWGCVALKGWEKRLAFLSIPLAYLATNCLYTWAGFHRDLERYLGPLYVLCGIPIASAALIPHPRWRVGALGALTIYGILCWAGPQFFPATFDCRRHALFASSIQVRGSWLEDIENGQFSTDPIQILARACNPAGPQSKCRASHGRPCATPPVPQ